MEQLADGKYTPWQLVDGSSARLIDGGDPNSNAWVFYTHRRGETTPIQLQLAWARVMNREASATSFGVGMRLHKNAWKAGQWTNASTTYTDDTTDFQDADTADAPLETTTINDGFIVQSSSIFNALSILVQTASTGSPVRILEYSNSSGGWTTLSKVISAAATSSNYTGSATENLLWWSPATDWAPIIAGHGTGLTLGLYGLRVRATTAPTVAGVATSMTVHRIYSPSINVAQYSVHQIDFGGFYAPLSMEGDALVFATSTVSTGHPCSALVRARG